MFPNGGLGFRSIYAGRVNILYAAGSTVRRNLVQAVDVIVEDRLSSRKSKLRRRPSEFDLREFIQRLGEVPVIDVYRDICCLKDAAAGLRVEISYEFLR